MATLASAVAWLILLDAVIGFTTANPFVAAAGDVGRLGNYFNYGRSVEGKVQGMLNGVDAHPLAKAGWIEAPSDQPRRPGQEQDLLIAAYGMSFAAHIVHGMADDDPRIAVRFAGGPGATLSHSYTMYLADRGHHDAKVVVLGILASSIPGLVTVSHMTWNFEAPSPHFYPRFQWKNGKLERYDPSIRSLDDLKLAVSDRRRWSALKSELAQHDAFYDPLVFGSFLDESAVIRLARRGLGQRSKRLTLERFHDHSGFKNESGMLDAMRGLVAAFVSDVRNDGKIPVVVAINDRGYSDHLHRVLAPGLVDSRALYFSTHELAPATEAGNFLADGHFVPAKDRLFARKLAELINARLGRRGL